MDNKNDTLEFDLEDILKNTVTSVFSLRRVFKNTSCKFTGLFIVPSPLIYASTGCFYYFYGIHFSLLSLL